MNAGTEEKEEKEEEKEGATKTFGAGSWVYFDVIAGAIAKE